MKAFVKRNWFILTMLTSIVAGCAVGAVWPGATCLQPIGTIFVNLMFCVVVPMVFCSISSAIANMKGMRRAGKIIMERAVVFKNGQDITGLDGSFQLAEDALQNGQFTVGALLRGQIGDPALDIFAGRVDRLDIDLIKIDKLQHGLHKKAKIHGCDKRACPLLDLHQAHHAELFQRFPHRNAADREHFTKRRFRRKLISGAIFSGNDLRLQFLRDIIAFGKLSAFNLLVQSGFLSRGKPLRR